MIKRRQPSKGTEKGPASASKSPEKSALNERRQDSGVINENKRPGEKSGRQHVQVSHDRHNGQYPHKSVPPGHGNNPDLLKYYLAQNFASPANLAREVNVSRAAVSAVIHGRIRSERIERMIAKSCGRTLQELFPAWYPENK